MPDENDAVMGSGAFLMPSAIVIAALYLAALALFEELGRVPIAVHRGTLLAPALRGWDIRPRSFRQARPARITPRAPPRRMNRRGARRRPWDLFCVDHRRGGPPYWPDINRPPDPAWAGRASWTLTP